VLKINRRSQFEKLVCEYYPFGSWSNQKSSVGNIKNELFIIYQTIGKELGIFLNYNLTIELPKDAKKKILQCFNIWLTIRKKNKFPPNLSQNRIHTKKAIETVVKSWLYSIVNKKTIHLVTIICPNYRTNSKGLFINTKSLNPKAYKARKEYNKLILNIAKIAETQVILIVIFADIGTLSGYVPKKEHSLERKLETNFNMIKKLFSNKIPKNTRISINKLSTLINVNQDNDIKIEVKKTLNSSKYQNLIKQVIKTKKTLYQEMYGRPITTEETQIELLNVINFYASMGNALESKYPKITLINIESIELQWAYQLARKIPLLIVWPIKNYAPWRDTALGENKKNKAKKVYGNIKFS